MFSQLKDGSRLAGFTRRASAAPLMAALAMAFGVLAAPPALAAPEGLTPRKAVDKSRARFEVSDKAHYQHIVVKFKEGTEVRQTETGALETALGDAALRTELDEIEKQVKKGGFGLSKRFGRIDTARLKALKKEAEEASGQEQADLSLYYQINVPPGLGKKSLTELVDFLNRKDAVEIAYASPKAEPAAFVSPPASPNFQSQQGYLAAAPNGVDALYAWTVPGGRGREIKVSDVEGGWRLTHEDMPLFKLVGVGRMFDDPLWVYHGTAVVGVMGAPNNGYGVTGISSDAAFSAAAIDSNVTSYTILQAGNEVGRGGVVLIELHAPGPADATPCTCNYSQCNFLPMEYWPDNFDTIQNLTARGITVVEAGGNGSVNLDDPAYGGAFDRQVRDSGAIMVGASVSHARTPACWTNFGSRIDVHGWGDSVVTTGYGDLYGIDEDSYYTGGFSGTSSATPIVAGSVANLQGVSLIRRGDFMTPAAMRNLLKTTGTPQSGQLSDNIGPLPNLRAAIATIPVVNTPTIALRGRVLLNGVATGGYGISGSGATCSVNGSDGSYSCSVPFNWSGTLTPSRSGYSFNPASRSYVNVQADRIEQDYQLIPAGSQWTVSGTVTRSGAPVRNVMITPTSNSGTATCSNSDTSGVYRCIVSTGWSGSLSASAAGYAFTPLSRSFSNVTAHQLNQNFSTGTAPGHSATIYYKKGFATPYIHYRPAGGAWTTVPGVPMDNDPDHCGYAVKTLDLGATATSVEVAFNNGAGQWDSRNGANYVFNEGVSTFNAGVISAGAPTTGPCSDQLVTFKVGANTAWGENIYIVGASAQLGAWDTSKAIKLNPTAYPTWDLSLSIPYPSTVEYKYIRKSSGGAVTWENGANRSLTTTGTSPMIRNDGNFR